MVAKTTVTPPAVCRRRADASKSTFPLPVMSTFWMATVHEPHAVFVTADWRAVFSTPAAAVVRLPEASSAEAGSALKITEVVTDAVASAQESVEGLLLRAGGEEGGGKVKDLGGGRESESCTQVVDFRCACARGGSHQPSVLHSKRSFMSVRMGESEGMSTPRWNISIAYPIAVPAPKAL